MMDPMIPATGVQGTSTGISIFLIADGKIVKELAEWDSLGMIQQITATPESEPPQ